MKKYLEIYVGSRGLLEGVEEKEFENIEEYLEKESKENWNNVWDVNDEMDEDYKSEIESYWSWEKIDNGYYLGLGDEEIKYYVDMECEDFVKWKSENVKSENWNDVNEIVMLDMLEECNMY